jgi:hypothetical protein
VCCLTSTSCSAGASAFIPQQQQQQQQQSQQQLLQQGQQQQRQPQQRSTADLLSDACRVPPLWRTHHIFSSTVTDPCPQQLVQGSWMNAAKANGVGGVLPYTAQVRAPAEGKHRLVAAVHLLL